MQLRLQPNTWVCRFRHCNWPAFAPRITIDVAEYKVNTTWACASRRTRAHGEIGFSLQPLAIAFPGVTSRYKLSSQRDAKQYSYDKLEQP